MDTSYKLCGIVYFGDSHFTARVIYNNGMIWFHDGLETGHTLLYEGTVALKTVPMIGHPEEIDQPHHGKMLQNW